MTDYTQEEKALIWLAACTELDYRARALLLRETKPSVLFRNFEKIAPKVIGETHKRVYIEGSLSKRQEELDAVLKAMGEKGQFAITSLGPDYPKELCMPDAPIVLFGEGKRELIKERKFCIVGSRRTPSWAEAFGQRLAERLSDSFVIVTGIAEGGDLAAVKGALASGRLICVLPCGLDECYPAAHASLKEQIAKCGLLLTECAPHEKVKPYSFHARNRILAALSEGTLVLSAGERSGALITADDALNYGREVFAVPYNPGIAQGAGCNGLIKNGAYLVTDERDILDCFGILSAPQREVVLSEGERTIMELLRGEGELHAAVLSERTGLPIYEIFGVLASLELKGLVTKSGGNRYSAV